MTRLRRSNPNGRGYARVLSGRGFAYLDPSGASVTNPDVRERLDRLVIPPAWTDVWISPYENGHILATGHDAAGRRQYIYHPAWRERMDRFKFDRALALAEKLPTARRAVTIDLRRDELDRARVLATAFRMLDQGSLRVGSERYALEHGSRGLSTLRAADARVKADSVELEFPGKSGKEWSSTIRDPELAHVIRQLKRRGATAKLLAWREDGRWHPVHAEEINQYIELRTGGAFTAKDFRTLHGTVAAARSLAASGPQPTVRARKSAIVRAVLAASEVLGNTPAIARKSYVDPRLIDAYEGGETVNPSDNGAVETQLRALLRRF